MSDKLVAYFSATGVTEKLANNLALALKCETYAIKPKVPYTAKDLDWQDKTSRSSVEMADKSSRPALADTKAPIADKKYIFLGFPIWWYVAPTLINSFLEAYDFSGKTIVLFATSGGSGFGKAVDGLKVSAPKANILEGKVFRANESQASLEKWVASLSL